MRFSTVYSLHRRAIVAAFDLSATNLHLLDSDHWLSNSKNVVYVRLIQPAWVTPEALAPSPEEDRAQQMRSWSVAGVVAFAKACDLEGLSTPLFASGVCGADLLAASRPVLENEVRLTPFAAAKTLRARDTFLQGS